MSVALQDLSNSPSLSLLQLSIPSDSSTDEDLFEARASDYIPPLPDIPQANPPPLQLAYIPAYPAIYTMSNYYPEVPLLHKVWILDCKSCGKFLTNRGMKAVLLLRPHVPLYSTDAMPVNCSAYNTSAPPARHSIRASSRSHPPGSTGREREAAPRTCECLTQSLACHGCGTQVGYMIVAPCARCTTTTFSTTLHNPRSPNPSANMPFFQPPLTSIQNRTTNGHRFVFHSSHVVSEERLYVSGEPGIVPDADPYDFGDQGGWIAHDVNHRPPMTAHRSPSSPPYVPQANTYPAAQPIRPQSTSSRVSGDSAGSLTLGHSRRSSSNRSVASPARSVGSPRIEQGFEPFPGAHGHHHPGSTAQSPAPSWPPKAPRIRGGDVLFWHHLICTGELPAMYDEERSRPSFGGKSIGYDSEEDDKSRLPGVGGSAVCGR